MAKSETTIMRETAAKVEAAKAAGADTSTGEIAKDAANTSTALAPIAPALPDLSGMKIVKRVTTPVLAFPNGATILVKFLSAIAKGKELKEGSRGPKMGVAQVATVQSHDGSERTLVVGTVLKAELSEAYPNDSYVGRWFILRKFAPNTDRGKDYSTYEIIEVEPPAANAA